ncbi:MAG: hypothetical protein IJ538_04245 [Clostridia bacterium]|nr:hypothetical protein [Clostridia bacterium]
MKKKILSLLCGIFMAVFSIFSLGACSTVKTNTEVVNQESALVIDGKTVTRGEIISAFSTYYQNNSSAISSGYYSNDDIEDGFYMWLTIREIIAQKAKAGLYNAETNPDGYLFYTDEEAKDVWNSVLEYVYSRVSTYEKTIYEFAGYDEDNYPVWIKDAEEDEEVTLFESYKSSKPENPSADRASRSVNKLTDDEVKAKLAEVKKYVFEYVSETDDDGNEVRLDIDETDYIKGARAQAYSKWIESLSTSAKSTGKSLDEKTLVENQIVDIYNAYYNSKLSTLLQEYYNNEKVLTSSEISSKAIVEAYLNEYFTDLQTYKIEDGYISVMNSQDGASLVLYHFNGNNYFFTVQHILVSYNSNQTDYIKTLTGYPSGTSVDYDEEIALEFRTNRELYTASEETAGQMLTEINDDQVEKLTSVIVKGDYYLLGDDGIYTKATEQPDGTYVVDSTTYEKEDLVHMATKQNILDSYDETFASWKTIVSNYLSATGDEKTAIVDAHEDMDYIFEVADNLATETDALNEKLASLLFVELEWIYSGDGLKNEISNKLGYVVSNYPDENGNLAMEFAVGARALMADIENRIIDIDAIVASGNVSSLTKTVVSQFGYHILKVENVYDAGSSLIDMSGLTIDLENEEFVNEMIERMKSTYVSTSSNETVYDYFFDSVYSSLTGSSGTYFVNAEYNWLNEYYNSGKIEFINKLSYSSLVNEIQ